MAQNKSVNKYDKSIKKQLFKKVIIFDISILIVLVSLTLFYKLGGWDGVIFTADTSTTIITIIALVLYLIVLLWLIVLALKTTYDAVKKYRQHISLVNKFEVNSISHNSINPILKDDDIRYELPSLTGVDINEESLEALVVHMNYWKKLGFAEGEVFTLVSDGFKFDTLHGLISNYNGGGFDVTWQSVKKHNDSFIYYTHANREQTEITLLQFQDKIEKRKDFCHWGKFYL